MSYQQAKWYPLSKKESIFSGGYVDNVQDIDMSPIFSPYLRNARLDGQSIIIRPGHDLFATLTAGDYPRGIGAYLRSNTADSRLVVRHNVSGTEKLVTITTGGTTANITTGTNITSNNKMRFVSVGDNIYTMNGVDPYGMLNGTTYSTPTTNVKGFVITGASGNYTVGETVTGGTSGATGRIDISNAQNAGRVVVTALTGTFITTEVITGGTSAVTSTISTISQFTPSFGVVFNSCMWLSGRSFLPNVVFKTAGDIYTGVTSTGSDRFTFQEQMTGLSANSEALFYFTENSISVTGFQDITETAGTVSYFTRPLTVKEGAVNHDCIIEVGAKTYYLATGNKICMLARGNNVNGFEVIELSDRPYAGISKLMGSLAKDQRNAFAIYYPADDLIKRHLYSQGSTFADIVVIYDVGKDKFLVDEQKYFTDGVYFEGYNYTTSAIEPKVYRDEYGQSDEDQPIPFEYYTKEHYLGDSNNKKIIRESDTLVDINELAGLEQIIIVDGRQVDSKTIDSDNIPLITGGIGTYEIGTSEIGTEGGSEDGDDMYEVNILRTKGNLNVKGKKIQRGFINNTLAGKVRLKNIDVKVEHLPELAKNLTR